MRYAIVLVLSLLVGGGVYVLTLRTGRGEAVAFGFNDGGASGDPAAEPEAGYAYLKVTTSRPSVQDRVQGFVGVVLLVALSAAALAFAIYQIGRLINETIERFLRQ